MDLQVTGEGKTEPAQAVFQGRIWGFCFAWGGGGGWDTGRKRLELVERCDRQGRHPNAG